MQRNSENLPLESGIRITLGPQDREIPVGVLYRVAEVGFDYWIIENLRLKKSDMDLVTYEKRKISGFRWIEGVRWT